jgi:hypothetical protein
MNLPAIGDAFLVAEAGLASFRADPVSHFRFKSGAQRRFAECLSGFREVYLRSGNQAGKTTIGAFCGVALARGFAEIDGVPLPLLGTPSTGVVLAKGRAMAKESVIKKYQEAIGNWPHHIERNGAAIEAIWVKPNRSADDSWRNWSCIRFFVEGGQSVAGMRLDWAHADEPPDWEMWLELRMRGKANRHFVRFITATPIDKREWKPLRDDFRGCGYPEGRDGKVELTMTVFDNEALSEEHKAAITQDARGPLQKAKLYGEYVDLTGTNPFDQEGLKRWSSRARAGLEKDWITRTGTCIKYEVWAEPDPDESYFVIADPSAGIWDEAGEHDPCEAIVVGRKSKSVVARYNGYIPAFELGRFCRSLAERYNRAMLVWERNSGYGEAFYEGCDRYGNVYIEHHRDSLHVPLSQRIGWLTTATTRGTIIGALQKAIVEDGLQFWSEAGIDSLGDVVIDRNGRIEAGAGAHDEDMIVLGLACHLLETVPLYERKRPKTEGELFLERNRLVVERDEDEFDPFG